MAKVAFVSFCLKSRDSVATETEKWIRIIEELGHEAHRVAGYIPAAGPNDHVIPGLNHLDPEIEAFTAALFDGGGCREELQAELDRLTGETGERLAGVLDELRPDLIITGNVLSLPLNLPFTAALCRWLEETHTACVAVHHDFYWNDSRYAGSRLPDIVDAYFPAPLPHVWHVTIDEPGREELYSHSGLAAICIERCHDFGAASAPVAEAPASMAEVADRDRELVFLQPACLPGHNCLDLTVSFLRRLGPFGGRAARLLLDGYYAAGDRSFLVGLPEEIRGRVIAAGEGDDGEDTAESRRRLYERCDAVIIPAAGREFGNSLLESIVYRKPLLVGASADIESLRSRGLQFLILDDRAAERVVKLMEHPSLIAEMVNRNYELGRRHFSLEMLRERVMELLDSLSLKVDGGPAGQARADA